jgi:S1-C subfamily serine protease
MTRPPRARRYRWHVACACLATWLIYSPPLGSEGVAFGKEITPERMTPVVRAVREARPAVVNIQGQKLVANPDPSGGGNEPLQQVNGMGTGIIIDERGYILTNYHVVADVHHIEVTLDDHRSFDAELLARDSVTDLAVIKIHAPEPLKVIHIGTSSDLMEGEPVIALGNAFGYEHTVTRGIISALNRDVQVSETQSYDDLIQTDASINPGNSGGPLMNIDGEMIGVNVAVRAGAQGIGFAIPVDSAIRVAAQLMSVVRLENKWHGLVTQEDDDETLEVTKVEPASPASKCGLRPGDEILRVGSLRTVRPLDLERALIDRGTGEPVPLEVVRDGRPLTLRLALATCPPDIAARNRIERNDSLAWTLFGLDLVEEPRSTFQKRSSRYRGGMRVVGVRPDSPASNEGILPGDILVGMHRWETASAEDIDYIVSRPNLAEMGDLKFYVLRGKSTLFGHLNLATTTDTSTRPASRR